VGAERERSKWTYTRLLPRRSLIITNLLEQGVPPWRRPRTRTAGCARSAAGSKSGREPPWCCAGPPGVVEPERGFRNLVGYRAMSTTVAALRARDAQFEHDPKVDVAKNA
jgi:hypothetical protein